MLSNIVQSGSIPIVEQVIHFTQARHAVLAGNIANLDTPGYHARDLSVGAFQGRLREAIESRGQSGVSGIPPAGFPGTSPGELALQNDRKLAEVAEPQESILRHDDGEVGLEREVSEMVKNQLQHDVAMTILRNQFQLLQTVISERV
jgi:flagellar basal-body rod protein FlgB